MEHSKSGIDFEKVGHFKEGLINKVKVIAQDIPSTNIPPREMTLQEQEQLISNVQSLYSLYVQLPEGNLFRSWDEISNISKQYENSYNPITFL